MPRCFRDVPVYAGVQSVTPLCVGTHSLLCSSRYWQVLSPTPVAVFVDYVVKSYASMVMVCLYWDFLKS